MRPIDADYILSALGVFTSEEPESANFMSGIRTAREIVEDAPTIGGWISVTDSLPEKKQTVMVSLVSEIDGHRMKRPQLGYPADDTGNMWYIVPWGEWDVDSDFKVTHWQPMPEPPEGVCGND